MYRIQKGVLLYLKCCLVHVGVKSVMSHKLFFYFKFYAITLSWAIITHFVLINSLTASKCGTLSMFLLYTCYTKDMLSSTLFYFWLKLACG